MEVLRVSILTEIAYLGILVKYYFTILKRNSIFRRVRTYSWIFRSRKENIGKFMNHSELPIQEVIDEEQDSL